MKNVQHQKKRKEEPQPEAKHVTPSVEPLDKGSRSLGRAMANGDGPPGDRGACEKESTTQGSE